MGALQNFLAVENKQVLIREYEIIGAEFRTNIVGEEERASFIFRKYPRARDDTNDFGFIDNFNLKEYFFHLLEEPVDDVTWLRIKQPGTYTIHFDLIPNSFSFELHTRDEIIHFSEHNIKRDINLEKGENCLLVLKKVPSINNAGSKIYVYYNI